MGRGKQEKHHHSEDYDYNMGRGKEEKHHHSKDYDTPDFPDFHPRLPSKYPGASPSPHDYLPNPSAMQRFRTYHGFPPPLHDEHHLPFYGYHDKQRDEELIANLYGCYGTGLGYLRPKTTISITFGFN